MKKSLLTLSLLAIVALSSMRSVSQTPSPVLDERAAAGDEPDNPGPLATNLNPNLKRAAILKAMTKVADWQLQHSEGRTTSGGRLRRSTTGFLLHQRIRATTLIGTAFSRLRGKIIGNSVRASLMQTTKPSG